MPRLRLHLVRLAVVLTTAALAACGPPNFDATTDQVYDPSRGTSERGGQVDVLNVVVVSSSPGAGTVIGALVSNTDEDDTLASVTVAGTEATIASGADTTVPADGSLNLADTGSITASSPEIEEGVFVEVTFTFEASGAVTLRAPVVPHEGEYADVPTGQAS